jgi:hypothetical protein
LIRGRTPFGLLNGATFDRQQTPALAYAELRDAIFQSGGSNDSS